MCYTCSSSSAAAAAPEAGDRCVHVCLHIRLMALFPLSVLHRETWNLNPPEVRNAQLQYAGWGPQGQQLVRNYDSNDIPKVKSQAILTVFHLAF